MEAEILTWMYCVLYVKCPSLQPDRKTLSFAGKARGVLGAEFEENPFNWSRDTAVKVVCPLSKSTLHYRSTATKLISFVVNSVWMLSLEFQENTWIGSRGTAVNVICSQSKVPFITGQLRPEWHSLQNSE